MNPWLLAVVAVACGTLPALALGAAAVATPFLVPLTSAATGAVAATVTFTVGGSFGLDFVLVALVANLLAASRLVASRDITRFRRGDWPGVAVLVVAVGWPLVVLSAPIIGYDTQAIWLPHAAMLYAGHSTLVSDLRNPALAFSNPDYPPLVPAAMAVGYVVRGHVDEHLAVVTVAVLNACAVAVIGAGLLQMVPDPARRPRRILALAVVAVFCAAVYGFSGDFALNGYADVLWSSAAAGAVLFGLVLPKGRPNAATAGLCLMVAAATKNEGTAVALVVAVVIGLRYVGSGRDPVRAVRTLVAAAVPLVPAAAWALAIRAQHIKDAFFATHSSESLSTRAAAVAPAMWARLHVVPVAAAVAVVGWWALSADRRAARLGHPVLLWVAAVWGTCAIALTYIFGALEIHWWLSTSVKRTTIFTDVLVSADMAAWALLALCGGAGRPVDPPAGAARGARSDLSPTRISRSVAAAVPPPGQP